MMEIFSKVNEEFIDGVMVKYNYHIDEYNVCWIRFIDMIEFLGLSERKADYMIANDILEEDKINFEDRNNYDDYGNLITKRRTYITKEAVNYLIERNNKHNNIFVKSVNGLSNKNNEAELDEIVNNMKKCMEDYNIDALIYNSGKLYNSELGRERMHELGHLDKNIEKVVDKVRDELYDSEVVNLILMDNNDIILSEFNKENDVWDFNRWING